jgi:hypothetical protein
MINTVRTYQINFDGANWNTSEQRFRTETEAVAYVRRKEGADGEIFRISEGRLEVRFNRHA